MVKGSEDRGCYEAAASAAAALAVIDPVLAGGVSLEGCGDSWEVGPWRVRAWRGIALLPPRARLRELAAAYARARALGGLSGAEATLEELLLAVEAYAERTLRMRGLGSPHGGIFKVLMTLAFPRLPETPVEALSLARAVLRHGGPRGFAARLLARLLREGLRLDRGPGRGRSRALFSAEDGSVEALMGEELAERVMAAAVGGGWWRRSWGSPPRRLAGLDSGEEVLVPGRVRRLGGLVYMLDVSASMSVGAVMAGYRLAESLWRRPFPRRRLALFDYGVRTVLGGPWEARREHLEPWGGTSLSKSLAGAPLGECTSGGVLVVYSDFGLEEADYRATVERLARLRARGCIPVLVEAGRRGAAPRGPWRIIYAGPRGGGGR